MRQLTSVDAQFLALESARQSGHVGGLAILDPSTRPDGKLTLRALHDLLAERLPLLPPLRWRLAEVPFGLDYPYWLDDPDFDLDFHVRELALSPPGNEEQLAEQVARIVARPLDRARPLWEVYLIHGLGADRVAMLTKIHHSLVDGLSGAEIMGVLLDLGPEGRDPPPPVEGTPDAHPTELEMLGRGLLGLPRYPVRLLRALPSALPNLDETAFNTLPGTGLASRVAERVGRTLSRADGGVLERTSLKAPRTSFNGRISPHRRFAFGRLSLEAVKQVKNRHGCTVNDVVVSICAGAVRRWLESHGELPDEPLVAQIPVSVRSSEQAGTFGNRIMLMSAPLFTNVDDPVDRLLQTHEALRVMKERHRALPAELLQDVNHFIPPAVFSRAARLTFALSSGAARPTWNLVISNVPGPQFDLYCAGARLEAHYPVSVITDGMGLNITVMSYCGKLDFGLVADRDQMPDLWHLMDWLEDELDELVGRD
ncbi:MAG TPA: wax ester/triacylglycerol synthase family O-acyltransferase [Thermoleophilaceae bacterium]|nr:wax ester/triacylglycerol synthase family O-acyltransferase [Thermoleophilaceae bacterium]